MVEFRDDSALCSPILVLVDGTLTDQALSDRYQEQHCEEFC